MKIDIFVYFDYLTVLVDFDELHINAVVQDVQMENIGSQSGSEYDNWIKQLFIFLYCSAENSIGNTCVVVRLLFFK